MPAADALRALRVAAWSPEDIALLMAQMASATTQRGKKIKYIHEAVNSPNNH